MLPVAAAVLGLPGLNLADHGVAGGVFVCESLRLCAAVELTRLLRARVEGVVLVLALSGRQRQQQFAVVCASGQLPRPEVLPADAFADR